MNLESKTKLLTIGILLATSNIYDTKSTNDNLISYRMNIHGSEDTLDVYPIFKYGGLNNYEDNKCSKENKDYELKVYNETKEKPKEVISPPEDSDTEPINEDDIEFEVDDDEVPV